MANILMVTNVPLAGAVHTALNDVLTGAEHTVGYLDDGDPVDHSGYDLVLLVDSGSFGSGWLAEDVPIVAIGGDGMTPLGLATAWSAGNGTDINVLDDSHPIATAAGLSSGLNTVYTAAGGMTRANPGTMAGGTKVARDSTSTEDRIVLGAFDVGDPLVEGAGNAVNRRVFFGAEVADQWNALGEAVFLACCDWAMDAEPSGNTRPATPTCSASATGETTATLTSSAFSDADGDAHAASQWQVTMAADTAFASPVFDSEEDEVNLTSCSVTGLTADTEYIARVRHKDDSGDGATEWSEWSAASSSFTTDEVPATTVAIDQSDPQAIVVGGTVQLSATVANGDGPTTWASDDEAVATVDSSGEVTGVGVGSADITATNNEVSDSITINVSAAVGSISDTVTLGGDPVQGARVWLIDTDDETLDTATTDAEGEFSFDDLPLENEYIVVVDHEAGETQYLARPKILSPS